MIAILLAAAVLSSDSSLRFANIRSTELEAKVLARALIAALPDHPPASFISPDEFEIDIVPPDRMPADRMKRDIVAFTTREPFSDGCTLHFIDNTIDDVPTYRSPLLIAHEVCHCVLDWEYINEAGYILQVTHEEAMKKEEDVKTCAGELAKEKLW
jgi:hypothetical protein